MVATGRKYVLERCSNAFKPSQETQHVRTFALLPTHNAYRQICPFYFRTERGLGLFESAMETPKSQDYSDVYSSRWNIAVQNGNYTDALECAIKGYLIAKDVGDRIHETAFLALIRFAIIELVDEPSKKATEEAKQGLSCSFCGRKKTEVDIVVGPGVAICQICAGNINARFLFQSQ